VQSKTIRLQNVDRDDSKGAMERGVRGVSKLSFLGLRPLYGAIAATAIAAATLTDTEPVPQVSGLHVGRGDFNHQLVSFAFSPTGRHMATLNTAGRVTLITRQAIDSEWEVDGDLDFPGYARAVAFSPDGRRVAVGGIARGICVWDVSCPSSEPSKVMLVPIQKVKRIKFSPDGQLLAVIRDVDQTIVLWDLAARRERTVLDHAPSIMNMVFSPDGRWLASVGSSDRSIILWDLRTGRRRALLENGPGPAMGLAFSPDGSMLASASFTEHHVRLWDLNTRHVRRVCARHTCSWNSLEFSPDGSLLATVGNDATISLWSVATGERRASIDSQACWGHTVAFSPDGHTLALATGDDNYVRLWDLAEVLEARRTIRPAKGPRARLASGASSGDVHESGRPTDARAVSPLVALSSRMGLGQRQRRGERALVDRVAHDGARVAAGHEGSGPGLRPRLVVNLP
jgi:WD40 repeat protein